MTSNSTKVLTFQFVRETKGAVLYRELDPNGNPIEAYNDVRCTIGSIYIRKSALDGLIPRQITLTLTLNS